MESVTFDVKWVVHDCTGSKYVWFDRDFEQFQPTTYLLESIVNTARGL